MNLDNLCMGCMTDKGEAGVCYQCEREEVLTSATLHHLPPRTILEDRYLVGKGIHEDALGITYIVLDLRSKQRLTIKEFLPRHLTLRQPGLHTVMANSLEFHQHFDAALEKFDTESRRLVALPPLPGMHKTLGRFRINNTAYRICTYVEGTNLQKFVRKNGGQISFKLLGKVLQPVFEALAMSHRAGMLHGNISPQHIIVNSRSQGALVNFSMSLPILTPFVKNIRNVVAEGFAPIEVYRDNRSIGTWTDVYSLAAVIYRSLTGRTPPPPATREQKGPLVPPSKLGKFILPEAEEALMKALSLKPADRFPSIGQFGNIVIESADSVERDKLEVAQDAFTSVLCSKCSATNEVLIQDLKLGSFPCSRCGNPLGEIPPAGKEQPKAPKQAPIEGKPVVPPKFQLPDLDHLRSGGPGQALNFPYPEPLETVICGHCQTENEVEPRAVELGVPCRQCQRPLNAPDEIPVVAGNNGFADQQDIAAPPEVPADADIDVATKTPPDPPSAAAPSDFPPEVPAKPKEERPEPKLPPIQSESKAETSTSRTALEEPPEVEQEKEVDKDVAATAVPDTEKASEVDEQEKIRELFAREFGQPETVEEIAETQAEVTPKIEEEKQEESTEPGEKQAETTEETAEEQDKNEEEFSFFEDVLTDDPEKAPSGKTEPESAETAADETSRDSETPPDNNLLDIRPTIDAAQLHTQPLEDSFVRKDSESKPSARESDIFEEEKERKPAKLDTPEEKKPNPFRIVDDAPAVDEAQETLPAEQPAPASGLMTTVECSNCGTKNQLTSREILTGATCKVCQTPFLKPRRDGDTQAAADGQGMIIEAGTPYRSPVPKIIFITTLILVTLSSIAFYWYLQSEEKERNYNLYLQQGNKKYYEDDFEGAIDDYRISLEYKPEDEYALQLIDRSEQAIAQIKERNREMEALAAFQELLFKADSVFYAKSLTEAKDRYQLALESSPYDTNSYILARLDEIKLLLENENRRRPLPVRSRVPKFRATDADNLLALLKSVEPGSIIDLTTGLFVLKEPITITKTVHIRGQGPTKTLIICSSAGNAISVTNNAELHAENMGFEYQGENTGNLLYAERATLTIEKCRFTGARFDHEAKRGGSGVFFGSNTRGSVKNSYFANNYIGISITQNAKPQVNQSVLLDNQFGLLISNKSRPTVTFNQVKQNNETGIYVTGTAQPVIENNKITMNKVNGMAFYNTNFSGHVRKNEILNNAEIGILLARNSRPTMEDNIVMENGKGGILFRDESKGIARRNRIENNKDEGINIADNAQPSIEDNQITGNKGDGIEVIDSARPIIDGNRILNNDGDGISVQVLKNGGLIQNNSTNGNRGYGISLLSAKRPNLLNNRTSGNYEGNIYDEDNQ